MSDNTRVQDVYAQMKEFHDKCTKPCRRLDPERKAHCFNTCDRQSKAYSSRFNNSQEGEQPGLFSEVFGVTYDDFVNQGSVFKS